ncbi:MAG: response regulator transcription factor [Lachnospiraceae bacterium]|nr:response regulator transcription factor [Lachnospiraceae bacterium]
MKKILIVEDEEAIGILMCRTLLSDGYQCDWVRTGTEGAERIERVSYSLILLDIMLPGLNGYELLEYIRPMGVPVIFVTAKGQVSERVYGLKLGADDYIVKPFQVSELSARVEAVLRRSSSCRQAVVVGDVKVDFESRTVTRNGNLVGLTAKEYGLLTELILHKNVALSRAQLYETVWNELYTGETRTLDCHIQRLRKKLKWEDRIKTVFRVGYRLEV